MSRSFFCAFRCLFALAILCGISEPARARERGPSVDVICPADPIPARIAGRLVLSYELHVTNFDRVSLTIAMVDVFGDSEQGAHLLSASGKTLEAMIADICCVREERL